MAIKVMVKKKYLTIKIMNLLNERNLLWKINGILRKKSYLIIFLYRIVFGFIKTLKKNIFNYYCCSSNFFISNENIKTILLNKESNF